MKNTLENTNGDEESLDLELSLRPPSSKSLNLTLSLHQPSSSWWSPPLPLQPSESLEIPNHPPVAAVNIPTQIPEPPNQPPAAVAEAVANNPRRQRRRRPPSAEAEAEAEGEGEGEGAINRRRCRRKPKTTPITPRYPWSTKQRAVSHELEYLVSRDMRTISGDVKCKQCGVKYVMEYDLVKKFKEIAIFIEINKGRMHDRAPNEWLYPVLPNCELCNQRECVEPEIPQEEDDDEFSTINWLFLLLGQLLGRLKLKQLKYFCAYTNNHRTGAKNRLLYLTYLTLCNQLQPSNTLFHSKTTLFHHRSF